MVQTARPKFAFQAFGDHLRADIALDAIRQTGSLVVRDVVPDGQAMAWAREILELLEAREGHRKSLQAPCGLHADVTAVYWSDAQVAARSNPSVLSANKQVTAALLGDRASHTSRQALFALGSQRFPLRHALSTCRRERRLLGQHRLCSLTSL